MKKGIIFLVLLLTISGAFAGVYVNPNKVMPGQVMKITVKGFNLIPIRNVIAQIYHEEGFDEVELYRKNGNGFNGEYEAMWVAHDTKNQEWYNLTIIKTNIFGFKSFLKTEYQDPVQSHVPEELSEGTFGSGNYTFPASVLVTKRIGVGTTEPTESLEIIGNLKIDGDIYGGSGNTIFDGGTGKFDESVMPY